MSLIDLGIVDSLPRYCPGFRGHPCRNPIKTPKGFCGSQCQGHAFEDLVADVLTALGYKIERNTLTLDGRESDLVAEKWNGLITVRFLVECKTDTQRPKRMIDAMERLCAAVTTLRAANKVDFGLLVFDKKPSPAAVAFGNAHCVIVCSVDDILYGILLSPKYEEELNRLWASSSRQFGLQPAYVMQDCMNEAGQRHDSLTFIRDWIEEETPGMVCVVGQSGIGKSTLMLAVVLEYLHGAQFTSARPVPFYAPIREILSTDKAVTTALLEFWKERFALDLPDFGSVDELFRSRRAFLVLDGLDELLQIGLEDRFFLRFQDFLQERLDFTRILVSSRDVNIVKRVVGARFNLIEWCYLENWSPTQVDTYLALPGQDDHATVRSLLHDDSRLRGFLDRPLFYRMLCAVYGDAAYFDLRVKVDSIPRLYDEFANRLLESDRWKTHRTATEIEADLKWRALRVFRSGDELLEFDRDLTAEYRHISFFEERGVGRFAFFHRSMQDYWIAQGLIDELRAGAVEVLSTRRFSQLVPEFIAHRMSAAEETIIRLIDVVVDDGASSVLTINAVEILGELNQVDQDSISRLVFSDARIVDQLWQRIRSEQQKEDVEKRSVSEALLNFLSILGSEDAARELIRMYRNPSFNVLDDSAFGIAYYGSTNVFLDETRKIVENPLAHYDRATCAFLLGEFGSREDTERLSDLLTEEDTLIQEMAEEAIEHISRRGQVDKGVS